MEIKITVRVSRIDFTPIEPPKNVIILLVLVALVLARPSDLPSLVPLLH